MRKVDKYLETKFLTELYILRVSCIMVWTSYNITFFINPPEKIPPYLIKHESDSMETFINTYGLSVDRSGDKVVVIINLDKL